MTHSNHDATADYRESSFREKMLEHVFISELLQEAWLRHGRTIEILRSEVDSSGYDLVLEYNNVVRHVQLKGSRAGAATARQMINTKLGEKPSGCVVWIIYELKPNDCRIELKYRFYGRGPGQPLPPLEEHEVARHTRGNAQGIKTERTGLRVVKKAEFSRDMGLSELMSNLFGPAPLPK